MSKKEDIITITCKVKQSLVKEEKSREDGIVITKFSGIASPGLFAKFDKDLEQAVFGKRFWSKISTEQLSGNYFMRINDIKSGIEVANIGNCIIKDIQIAVGAEDVMEAVILVKHEQTALQPALEAAISTIVQLSFSIDDTILGEGNGEEA